MKEQGCACLHRISAADTSLRKIRIYAALLSKWKVSVVQISSFFCKEAAMRPLRRFLGDLNKKENNSRCSATNESNPCRNNINMQKSNCFRILKEDLAASMKSTKSTAKCVMKEYHKWATEYGSI
mmetsp:Transcript_29056/g.66534  ORF Transcript_29056/g.66534 Transcript_29056/m.66534 type:complete len:125 (+) Transcript_29056:1097-1471(+)